MRAFSNWQHMLLFFNCPSKMENGEVSKEICWCRFLYYTHSSFTTLPEQDRNQPQAKFSSFLSWLVNSHSELKLLTLTLMFLKVLKSRSPLPQLLVSASTFGWERLTPEAKCHIYTIYCDPSHRKVYFCLIYISNTISFKYNLIFFHVLISAAIQQCEVAHFKTWKKIRFHIILNK